MFNRKVRYRFLKFLRFINELLNTIRAQYKSKYRNYARVVYAISGIISLITLTIEYGFYYPKEWTNSIEMINLSIVIYLFQYELSSFLFTSQKYTEYIKNNRAIFFILLLLTFQWLFGQDILSYFHYYDFGTQETALVFLSISQFFLLVSNLIRFFRTSILHIINKINPSLIFILSFALVISVGVLFLHLPKAQKVNLMTIDIIFTVVSAVCVTGLSTISIFDSFTFFGQIILIVLIQIGGLGLMTLTTFFAIFLTGKASVNDKLLMKDLLSEETVGKVSDLLKNIAVQTITIETIGILLLYIFVPPSGYKTEFDRIFYAIFHSVSAFCNAGFSLYNNGLAEDFFVEGKLYVATIMILITFGGVGFPVIKEFVQRIKKFNDPIFRFSISSKLVLIVSIMMFLFGTATHYFLEQSYTIKDMNWTDQLFYSMFYSVTCRTAGFNTLDIGKIGIPMTFISLFLMWVGASPNSTGGGIKTTTIAISFLQMYEFVKGKTRLDIFNRTISQDSIIRASASIVLSLFVIFTAIFLLIVIEKFSFIDICFEVVSAFGTVGLTRGITTKLDFYSKIVISSVMFIGRVGILTMLIAIIPKYKSIKYKYPIEYVVVG